MRRAVQDAGRRSAGAARDRRRGRGCRTTEHGGMTAVTWTKAASEVAFVLNGVEVRSTIDLATTAFDLLRHDFRLTSVRSACDGIGMCGACTILVNGRASPSCLLLAIDLAGARVQTVDGLAEGERFPPLRQAFVAKGAL